MITSNRAAYWFAARKREIETAIGRIQGGWAYEMRIQEQNGRWVIAELRLFPDSDDLERQRLFLQTKFAIEIRDSERAAKSARQLGHHCRKGLKAQNVPPGGLTTRHLRAVPFGKNSPLGFFAEMDGYVQDLQEIRRRRNELAEQERVAFTRLKRLTGEARLAWIARCYVETLRRGSRKQNADVARQLHMTVTQVRDSILWARRRGLLSATRKQGLPGGELTQKALNLLEGFKRLETNPRLAAAVREVMVQKRPIGVTPHRRERRAEST